MLNPKTKLLIEEKIQPDNEERIYAFTKRVMDPNACKKVELAPGKFIHTVIISRASSRINLSQCLKHMKMCLLGVMKT
jgi:hypothetical protein